MSIGYNRELPYRLYMAISLRAIDGQRITTAGWVEECDSTGKEAATGVHDEYSRH
jgi:hypothetical protein